MGKNRKKEENGLWRKKNVENKKNKKAKEKELEVILLVFVIYIDEMIKVN